jgi:hypothetical protein
LRDSPLDQGCSPLVFGEGVLERRQSFKECVFGHGSNLVDAVDNCAASNDYCGNPCCCNGYCGIVSTLVGVRIRF